MGYIESTEDSYIISLSKLLVLMIYLVAVSSCADATLVGLNQIMTPDIQRTGLLSINFQFENPVIGDSKLLLLDLGINRSLEFAYFKGFSTGQHSIGAQVALVQKKSFILSAGTLGLETVAKSQPFLEGGYYRDKYFVVAGVQKQDDNFLVVGGISYNVTSNFQITSDYISGQGNFSTLGCVWYITPAVYLNPAIFISNSSPHDIYGFGTISWDVKVW